MKISTATYKLDVVLGDPLVACKPFLLRKDWSSKYMTIYLVKHLPETVVTTFLIVSSVHVLAGIVVG